MITRLLVIDPQPEIEAYDEIVFQVPENSRAMELLMQLLSDASIEHTILEQGTVHNGQFRSKPRSI